MSTQNRPRAAIYCRVSTRGQEEEGTSLASQEAACRRYAAERGYAVVEDRVYREVHTGAELWERPQLAALREAVRRKAVGAVIIYALDRLSRRQAHVAIVADECDRAGVLLLFVTEEFERSAVGEFIRAAKGFAAEVEREKLLERTQRGITARLQGGKLPPMSKPPYGYRWRGEDKGALDIDEATAPIVRRMFAACAGGAALRTIARELNEGGIPTPTGAGRWHFATVRKMLMRDLYIGVARGKQTDSRKVAGRRLRIPRPEAEQILLPEGTVPALVGREQFAVVQERLARNQAEAVRNHRHPERFLLRAGFICCGYCGKSIGAYCGYDYRQKGRTYRLADRYRSNPHNTDCPPVWANAAEVDADIWRRVRAILEDPAIIEREVAKRRQADPTAADRAAVERGLADIARQQGNLARTLALIEDEDSTAPLLAELAALGERKRALLADREALAARHEAWRQAQLSLDGIEAWCRKVGRGLEHADYARKRKALTALGVRVPLYAAGHTPRWGFETAFRVEGDTIVPGAGRAVVDSRARAGR
ncbi:MAG: recombinase family protein [Chloroflexota bacterium]|nr:recombinase family protein [Chloroflexota bacterium]